MSSESTPNMNVEDMIIDHSMSLMIDVMTEVEAKEVIESADCTRLDTFARVLLRRIVDYLADDDAPPTDELVDDPRRLRKEFAGEHRLIIDTHQEYLRSVSALVAGAPVDGTGWRQVRRAFNHFVDSFRECTDRPWPFLNAFSPRTNMEGLAS